MNKHRFLRTKRWGILLLVMAVILAACSNSGTDQGKEGDKGGSSGGGKKKVELIYQAWYQPYLDYVQQSAVKYQELHPELEFSVKAEILPFGKYWDKLLTQAAGNVLPDIFDMNGPNFYDYVTKDLLLSLQPYIPDSEYKEDEFVKSIQDLYRYKDELYGVSAAMDGNGIFYNKKIFDENHVPYPDDTWDLEKFRSVAKQLTKAGSYWGASISLNMLIAQPYLLSQGGAFYNEDKTESLLDSKENIETMQFLQDMIFVDKSAPDKTEIPNDNPETLFVAGKIAMHPSGSALSALLQPEKNLDWDVAPYPEGSKGRIVVTHGPARVVSANSKNKDIAADFVLFLGLKDSLVELSKNNISSRKDLQQNFIDTQPDKNLKVLVESTSYAAIYPSTANFKIWNNEITKQGDLLMLNQTKPKEALQAAAAKMNEALKNVPKGK
ncbi:ABC transporter substrate-binding protein [Paenibacillus eucommiae]|uniref:Multiple sugar transport system substrate-binding protein n=1 Tax=Paenibacillus eucommiae TaxID=1355755 RepID=A0ABS4ILR6_9BACL|nr:sugar ABC transporter substrate-binding protein [Paenibacillus eucommiae]MBP1988509.1 multiple sugar transport system substrate-binding protein [Paenibacillus eucommiae]